MKKQTAGILLLAMLVVFVFTAAPRALAAQETADVFYLEEKAHMMVTVGYTAGAPKVHFLAPDGTTYDNKAVVRGKMRMEDVGDALIYRIPNASAGQWRIVYDKGANSKLDISWAPYVELLQIQSFSYQVKTDAPNQLEAKLHVSYINDCRYRYRIYAALTDEAGNVTGTQELTDGTAMTNEESAFTVNISSLATYDKYYLMAQAEVDDVGATVSDTYLGTDAFGYTDPDMPEAMKDVRLEIDVSEGMLKLNWSEYAVSCAGYVLGVYADGVSVYANTFDATVTAAGIPIDCSAGIIKVQLGYTTADSGKVSQLLTREADLSHAKAVVLETEDKTSQAYAKLRFDVSAMGSNVSAVVTVNGAVEEYTLNGSNTMTVALGWFDNDLTVSWYSDAQTCYTIHRSIYYAANAPTLTLPEITADVTTELDTYILAGYTDPGCKITVNGKEVEINADGSFRTELELTEDISNVTVTAENQQGVATSRSFRVIRAGAQILPQEEIVETQKEETDFSGTLLGFLPLILTVLGSAVLLVFVLRGPGAFDRQKKKRGLRSAMLWLCGYVLSFVDIVFAGVAGLRIWKYIYESRKLSSVAFYEAASNSVTGAYNLLERSAQYKKSMILWIWVLSVAVLGTIVLFVLATALKNTDGKRLKPGKKPERKEPAFKTEEKEPAGKGTSVLPAAPVFVEPVEDKEVEDAIAFVENMDAKEDDGKPKREDPELDAMVAYAQTIEAENTAQKDRDPDIAGIRELIGKSGVTPAEEPERWPAVSAGGMKRLNLDDFGTDDDEPEHQSLELPR